MNDDEFLDEFIEYDFTMGADVTVCPYCGKELSCSLFFDKEIVCPACGEKFKKDQPPLKDY